MVKPIFVAVFRHFFYVIGHKNDFVILLKRRNDVIKFMEFACHVSYFLHRHRVFNTTFVTPIFNLINNLKYFQDQQAYVCNTKLFLLSY